MADRKDIILNLLACSVLNEERNGADEDIVGMRKKMICTQRYEDKETAAHASDALARELIANGERGHRLNFPNDKEKEELSLADGETKRRKVSEYIGVYYNRKHNVWRASRQSKTKRKMVHNGSYRDQETAAQASDALARFLMANGDTNLKMNFREENIEDHNHQKNKRKRPFEFENY
jgi:hypothetical protein